MKRSRRISGSEALDHRKRGTGIVSSLPRRPFLRPGALIRVLAAILKPFGVDL